MINVYIVLLQPDHCESTAGLVVHSTFEEMRGHFSGSQGYVRQ